MIFSGNIPPFSSFFKSAQNELAIFVDLDETLVHNLKDIANSGINTLSSLLAPEDVRQLPLGERIQRKRQIQKELLEIPADQQVQQLAEIGIEGYLIPSPYDRSQPSIAILRPHAREFLETCQSITPNVFLLTSGQTEYQTIVCEAVGIASYFVNIIGKDEYQSIGAYNSILVDDQNPSFKLQALGYEWDENDYDAVDEIAEQRVVRVSPFMGDPGDSGLIAASDDLRNIINNQP